MKIQIEISIKNFLNQFPFTSVPTVQFSYLKSDALNVQLSVLCKLASTMHEYFKT